MKKKCSTCKTVKDISEFNKNKSKNDGYNTICRECSKIKSKEYYTKNKDKHLKDVNIRRQSHNDKMREIINESKSDGCQLCPETEFVCLDFHHVDPTEKEYAVSRLVSYSEQKLRREISKCVVLCSNCHRKLHAGLIEL